MLSVAGFEDDDVVDGEVVVDGRAIAEPASPS
jgi:hypothetical protein